jgi:hypothetical protein
MSEKNKALLPGFGRPLNYVPHTTAPDYVGDLFNTALSTRELESDSLGVAWVIYHACCMTLTRQ